MQSAISSPRCATVRRVGCCIPRRVLGGKGRAEKGQAGDSWDEKAINMIDAFAGKPKVKAGNGSVQTSPAGREPLGNGVLILLAINFGMFALTSAAVSWVPHLYLWGANAKWYQFVTSAFCHANFHHLSSNMFLLYVFGKTVEDEEGAVGVIVSYLLCAVGGCLASFYLAPNATLLGASGACFGLFMISALLKLKLSFRRLLELAAITPFVYEQVTSNISAQVLGTGLGNVSYVAHLGGGVAGVALVALLSMLPSD